MRNGSFEKVDGNEGPAEWDRFNPAYAKLVQSGGGERFLQIRNDNPQRQAMIHQQMALPEGLDRVWVTVRMQTENLKPGEKPYESARVQMSHYDAEGERLGYGWSPSLKTNSGWTEVSGWYELKPGAAEVRVGVGMIGTTGVASFDDLRVLTEQPSDELAAAAEPFPKPQWEGEIETTIFAAPAPAGSAEGRGTEDLPYDVAKAVREAEKVKARNEGVRLVLLPGTYREPLILNRMDQGHDTQAPFIIEGSIPGEVIFTGSDVWADGWSAVEGEPGVYAHHWPNDWGTPENPWAGWRNERGPVDVHYPPIARRWEMVRIDDQPLRQVLERAELQKGQFYVDEEGDQLLVHMPDDRTPAEAKPAVALRNRLLAARGRTNLTLRGLTFEGAASGATNRPTAGLSYGIGITIEDCDFSRNNGSGFGIFRVDHLVIRDSRFNDNGAGGLGGGTHRVALIENVEASRNNWRGY